MRPSFTAALAATALLSVSSLPAAAAVDRSARETARFAEDGSIRLRFARATIDDDGYVRTRRRARDRWERPRRARRHTLRHRSIARRPARLTRSRSVQSVPSGLGLVGTASYYGGRFHGRLTASGARFDANGMTAAHRSLPFGTRVRVTHLGTGRSVNVRITDRGPFIGGRIIDLSHGAAGVIGMHRQGVARVQVTVLGR
jgi:rare lipoprotein A (peptidoglycan hydrolase)